MIIECIYEGAPYKGKTIPKGATMRVLEWKAKDMIKTGYWKESDAEQTEGEKLVAEYAGGKKEEENAPIKVEVVKAKSKKKA